MVAKTKKVAYFAHLEQALNAYARACIVDFDFVGSRQVSDIRVALRGRGEMIHGKNTMIRTCIRNMIYKAQAEGEDRDDLESIIPVMKGNLGFIFTDGDIGEIKDVLAEHVKPAAAKAGVIAPVSCTIPKGPTGLDPAQTSFFQALNIATKINKGAIEIINDCQVLVEGTKVGTSEAALLQKLGVRPFEYGLRMVYIFEGGIFDPKVLQITEATLMAKWSAAVGFVASLSLAVGMLTEASLGSVIVGGVKNIIAVALECDYLEFEAVKKVKALLDAA
jgi:large subunit ribosomal protein LP0